MDVLYPLLLFGTIGTVAIIVAIRRLPMAERGWCTRILVVAIALRFIVATMFAIVPETRIFHEDASGYEYFGMRLADAWRGIGPPYSPRALMTQNYGFTYVAGAIYYVFGNFRPLVSYFNSVIGVITVFAVYRLARQFYHPLVARRAALLVAVFPSMVLWSSVAIKDPLMALLILIGLSCCISLKRRFTLTAAVGVAFSLLAMQPIRFYMIYFLGFAIFASLFVERGTRVFSGLTKQVFVVGVVVALLVLVGLSGKAEQGAELLTLDRVSSFRHGMATTANSGFSADADVSTPAAAIAFLPLGLAELLLGPFPWQFGSLRALMAAPETIVWWLMFPATIRGMYWMFRKRFSETSPLLIFSVIMSCAYSLVHGNVGSGFRQRAQIFIILFVFSALGSCRRRCRRAGLDPDLLLVDSSPPTTAAQPSAPRPVRV